MGVLSYDMEAASPVPPAKLFQAFVIDSDKLLPKIMPEAVKSVETLEGDGGPGTIKQVNFGEGSQFIKSVKNRVDAIDKENFTYAYTVIESDPLMKSIEKISNDIKFEASPDGGCIFKNSSKYHTLGDAEINEEALKAGKEKAMRMFKAVEAYLLANPDAY